MEHTSGLVAEGKVLHNTTYKQRPEKYKEILLSGSKIDYFDPKAKVIYEVKKSDKMLQVDIWQVKYYILLFEQNGISGVIGKLQYPYLRETKKIMLVDSDKKYLNGIIQAVLQIISDIKPPPRVRKNICSRCSYHDFCWVTK